MNFMFILSCEFSVVSEYDEINCNIIFGIIFQCIFKSRLWLNEITMNMVF